MRKFARSLVTLCLATSVLSAGLAVAQIYPEKPVRIMVGMAPGGSNDTIARLIGSALQERLHQPFIVENKPGANSTIATAEVARAQPDGYNLMLVISSHVTNTMLFSQLNYKLEDFKPVTVIAETPFVLVANPKFKPNNVSEFIKYAKSNKERTIDFGTPGMGSTQHIAMELMDQMAGTKMNHVPYKGGAPAQADLIGGVIPVIFATPTQSLPFLKNGQLKALGVTSPKRLPQLPDIPTFTESGLTGYDANVWFGIVAPANTPDTVVQLLNKEIVDIISNQPIRGRLEEMGLTPVGSTPEAFAALLESEKKKWAEVIKIANISLQ
ncbi:tripartite tricarboxylate transporter substrate binding protein [Bordetella sp. 15P40C-2]|uniref:Bug family tripartite tricarboxylate transporter substrate binding protein n=1 Tax=Bordetella sp. 15P40C-2 TaxID=2572246 RepID=UPI00132C2F98|nr:tripartite tricarboxylate transporter substrate binding protein [Bordetella sp. 15P40C-2]MVW72746.1 tripartite tricarboxylate transporter substrate binding protein [Bordetella sp. 15P40C-2]